LVNPPPLSNPKLSIRSISAPRSHLLPDVQSANQKYGGVTYLTRVSQRMSWPSREPPFGRVHFAWNENRAGTNDRPAGVGSRVAAWAV
jgi:hypothetical protein